MNTFEGRLKHYEKYIRTVAKECEYQSRLYDREDLYQEIALVLWRCYEHYQNLPENEFHKLFVTSFNRRLASIFRGRGLQNEEQNLTLSHLTGANPSAHTESQRGHALSRGMFDPDGEVGEEFYSSGIERILSAACAKAAEAMRRLIRLEPKASRTNSGVREAYEEAKLIA